MNITNREKYLILKGLNAIKEYTQEIDDLYGKIEVYGNEEWRILLQSMEKTTKRGNNNTLLWPLEVIRASNKIWSRRKWLRRSLKILLKNVSIAMEEYFMLT